MLLLTQLYILFNTDCRCTQKLYHITMVLVIEVNGSLIMISDLTIIVLNYTNILFNNIFFTSNNWLRNFDLHKWRLEIEIILFCSSMLILSYDLSKDKIGLEFSYDFDVFTWTCVYGGLFKELASELSCFVLR